MKEGEGAPRVLLIEVRGRLVEKEGLPRGKEGHRQGKAGPLPDGKLRGFFPPETFREMEGAEDPFPLLHVPRREAEVVRDGKGGHREPARGAVGRFRRIEGDPFLPFGKDFPLGEGTEPLEGLQEGRLPGSRVPEEKEKPSVGEEKGRGLEGEAGILPLVVDRHFPCL